MKYIGFIKRGFFAQKHDDKQQQKRKHIIVKKKIILLIDSNQNLKNGISNKKA